MYIILWTLKEIFSKLLLKIVKEIDFVLVFTNPPLSTIELHRYLLLHHIHFFITLLTTIYSIKFFRKKIKTKYLNAGKYLFLEKYLRFEWFWSWKGKLWGWILTRLKKPKNDSIKIIVWSRLTTRDRATGDACGGDS